MSSTNLRNVIILYEFLITEHNNQNIKLNTILTHTKILSLFNNYTHYKDFEKITKDDIMNYLNSLRKRESISRSIRIEKTGQ